MEINSLKSGIAKLTYLGTKFLDYCIFYGGKMAGRIIFPIQLMLNIKYYVKNKSYFPESKLKKPFQIFFEQLYYIFRTGEINKNYFIFGFDQKSKNDFNNYVPWFTFLHARNKLNQQNVKSEYDPYNYICLLRDKFVFEAFYKGIGISTPTNIGMINDGELFLVKESKFISINEIINYEFDAFCKRNVSYGGGMSNDILKLKICKGNIFINNKEVLLDNLKQFFGNNNWIIQERIQNQSPEYARFHPNSVNTMRIVSIKYGLKIDILCAFFRMGVNGSHTDNISSGGIVCGINIENGTLVKWGFYGPAIGTKSDKHPNSNILFEGYKLPHWEKIVQYVKNTHQLFYGLHSIGWDVIVTTNGIMFIEGNDNWDSFNTQLYKGEKQEFDKYFR